MASQLALWEMDPFFEAAEEVQQSADRMESLYRTWVHSKDHGEETLDKGQAAEICKRELITALDTAKWQLEEFERAVTEASLADGIYMGDDAPKRHVCFIEAIKMQIISIETNLWGSAEVHSSKSFHSVNLDDEDRDQLEMFLSGCRLLKTDALKDRRIHPIEDSDSRERSPVSVFKTQDHSEFADCSSDSKSEAWETRLGKGYFVKEDQINGFHVKDSIERDFACAVYKPDELESVDYSESDENKSHGYDVSLRSDWHEGRCEYFTHGQKDGAEEVSKKQESLCRLTNGEKTQKFAVNIEQNSKLMLSESGFKRWKDGDMGLINGFQKKIWMAADSNDCMADLELGSSSTASNREDLGLNISAIANAGKKQIDEWRVGIEQKLQHARHFATVSLSAQRAFLMVIILGLIGIYFWFLSSIVPYISTMIPGSSLDSL